MQLKCIDVKAERINPWNHLALVPRFTLFNGALHQRENSHIVNPKISECHYS